MKDPDLKLIPFDLERAKAGDPLVTREGRPARIICFDRISSSDYVLVVLGLSSNGNEWVYSVTSEGRESSNPTSENSGDLFMKPLNITRYRLIWVDNISKLPQYKDYDSMEDALLIYKSLPEAIFPFEVHI